MQAKKRKKLTTITSFPSFSTHLPDLSSMFPSSTNCTVEPPMSDQRTREPRSRAVNSRNQLLSPLSKSTLKISKTTSSFFSSSSSHGLLTFFDSVNFSLSCLHLSSFLEPLLYFLNNPLSFFLMTFFASPPPFPSLCLKKERKGSLPTPLPIPKLHAYYNNKTKPQNANGIIADTLHSCRLTGAVCGRVLLIEKVLKLNHETLKMERLDSA